METINLIIWTMFLNSLAGAKFSYEYHARLQIRSEMSTLWGACSRFPISVVKDGFARMKAVVLKGV